MDYKNGQNLRKNSNANVLQIFAFAFHIRCTQLLIATGIERGIHDCQVLKYQPSVTSRVIFHHLIPLIIIEYQSRAH